MLLIAHADCIKVAKDLYSTPGLILEIVAKIFVFMPRIEVYWELFSDQKDILDIRGLLLDIYKSIISFNVDSVIWFATSRIGKSTVASSIEDLTKTWEQGKLDAPSQLILDSDFRHSW